LPRCHTWTPSIASYCFYVCNVIVYAGLGLLLWFGYEMFPQKLMHQRLVPQYRSV
jgi:threonine/homoserine/homoserine lactone efflux protein